ncbi:putative retrotransposon gag protein [Neofusicoccum parvum]|uniref:Retrotransposon gag protein n=1 Tax=Neofusicoccum parvum TaxID=310453 RepID=A0ACB5S6B1_9PEZI|nr:putative retrotransposon gag protein [Neofusicoccum parvum]
MLTRNEEVLDLDNIIESFPHDDEIVNSENDEFYDSTEAEEDSSDEKDLVEAEESPLAGAINRLLEKVEEHGIITKIPLHHGESEQGIWIPNNQPGLALVTWQMQEGQL